MSYLRALRQLATKDRVFEGRTAILAPGATGPEAVKLIGVETGCAPVVLREAQVRVNAAFNIWAVADWLTDHDREVLGQTDQALDMALFSAKENSEADQAVQRWEERTLSIFRKTRMR